MDHSCHLFFLHRTEGGEGQAGEGVVVIRASDGQSLSGTFSQVRSWDYTTVYSCVSTDKDNPISQYFTLPHCVWYSYKNSVIGCMGVMFCRRLSSGLKPSNSKLQPPSGSSSSATLTPVTSTRPVPLKPPHQLSATVVNVPPPDRSSGAGDIKVNSLRKLNDSQRKARQKLRMDSSDLGYLCEGQTSHMQIRTADFPAVMTGSARVVRVGRIAKSAVASESTDSAEETMHFKPSPPPSAKPTGMQRPSSASRFRTMVLHCRDGTWRDQINRDQSVLWRGPYC